MPSCTSCMYSTKLSKKAVRFLRTFVVVETNCNRSLINAHATTLYTKTCAKPTLAPFHCPWVLCLISAFKVRQHPSNP